MKRKKDEGILDYIRKHKKIKGISKTTVDFYTEYKLNKNKGES